MSGPPSAEPLRGDATAERVRLLIDARRTQDALGVAYQGLVADPGNADLMGLIAWAILVEGDAMRAREWAEQSLSIQPGAAWVHDLRARALLDGAGTPQEAVAAARTAVQIDPECDAFLFTLVGACLECRDRPGAEQAVQALRHAAPASKLGPLAAAAVELDRSRAYLRQVSVGRVAVLAVLTQGTGLFLLGVWWLVQSVLRAPYLRRVDALLHEALRLDPGSAHVRAIAADILRLRFRFAQSVDYEVAAAAIDAGLVEADPLAKSIAGRTTALTAVCSLAWLVGVAVIDRPIASHVVVALIGLGLAVAFIATITGFYHWQTRSLPPLLLRNVRSRWPLPTVAVATTAIVILAGVTYLTDPGQPARGYHLASLFVAPLVLACTGLLLARFVGARRRA